MVELLNTQAHPLIFSESLENLSCLDLKISAAWLWLGACRPAVPSRACAGRRGAAPPVGPDHRRPPCAGSSAVRPRDAEGAAWRASPPARPGMTASAVTADTTDVPVADFARFGTLPAPKRARRSRPSGVAGRHSSPTLRFNAGVVRWTRLPARLAAAPWPRFRGTGQRHGDWGLPAIGFTSMARRRSCCAISWPAALKWLGRCVPI